MRTRARVNPILDRCAFCCSTRRRPCDGRRWVFNVIVRVGPHRTYRTGSYETNRFLAVRPTVSVAIADFRRDGPVFSNNVRVRNPQSETLPLRCISSDITPKGRRCVLSVRGTCITRRTNGPKVRYTRYVRRGDATDAPPLFATSAARIIRGQYVASNDTIIFQCTRADVHVRTVRKTST